VLADPVNRLQLTSIDQAAIRAAIEDRAMLLAACEALVATCRERFEGLEIVALVPGDLRRAVDMGTAAIAAAKGAS
jgi:hypothetical protein